MSGLAIQAVVNFGIQMKFTASETVTKGSSAGYGSSTIGGATFPIDPISPNEVNMLNVQIATVARHQSTHVISWRPYCSGSDVTMEVSGIEVDVETQGIVIRSEVNVAPRLLSSFVPRLPETQRRRGRPRRIS